MVRLAGGSFGFPSPFAYIGGPGYFQMSLLYDTLVWKDASGRLLPWLARRVQRSRDGLTYRFELRDGIRWHDGRPLTAEDVAFTFEYFARQTLGPLLVAQPFAVKGARAAGRLVAEVALDAPVVTFLGSVAGAVPIIPKHVWSGIADAPKAQDRDVLIGSGAYRLTSFSLGEGSALFEENRGYFPGRPFVRRVELRPVDDELTAMRAGEIDAAQTPPEGVGPDALAPFRSDRAFGIASGTGRFTFPLIFNIARGGALADARFRRACALAIDRREIVKRLVGGDAQLGNPGFLPPDHPYHVAVEQYDFDPRAAAAMLDATGHRRPLRFRLLTGNAPVPPFLDLLVGGLKDVGVELEPQAVDLPTLFGRMQQGADDIVLGLYPGPGNESPNADPDSLRQFYSSRVKGRLQGAQGYVNHELDRLADRQLVTADAVERRRLVGRIQRIVARDLPALPLYYPRLYAVFRKRALDCWYFTPGGFAGGLPDFENKQALITGRRTGAVPRKAAETKGAGS